MCTIKRAGTFVTMSERRLRDFAWLACGTGLGALAYHTIARLTARHASRAQQKKDKKLRRRRRWQQQQQQHHQQQQRSKRLRLTYLDIKGVAEPIRLALFLGDVAFEDRRVSYEQVAALREDGSLAFGQVPLLELLDGVGGGGAGGGGGEEEG